VFEAVTGDLGDGIYIRAASVAYLSNRFEGDTWLGSRIHFIGGGYVDTDDSLDELRERIEKEASGQ
jgi:hypothetical protein